MVTVIFWRIFKAAAVFLGALLIVVTLISCRAFYPEKVAIDQRLSSMPNTGAPVAAAVKVYWNDFAVPFVEAENDTDLAFALGNIHAHLRLGQMEFLKRVANGRISEMAGPFAEEIDYTLRILDLGKITQQQEQQLPTQTRQWLEHFVRGINYYQARNQSRPPEFGLLGIEFEPWTVKDVLTIARLAGSDVTWFSFFSLLNARLNDSNYKQTWQNFLKQSQLGVTSFEVLSNDQQAITSLLAQSGRHGSNSVVVAANKSQSAGALIANDPHLGLSLPNLWLVVGVKSPSYHCVGLMIPGVPIFGLGRNQQIAWGGTNMRAAASDLVAVGPQTLAEAKSYTTEIKQRFWWSTNRTVRVSKFGPIVSDSTLLPSKQGEALALRWTGHSLSDEISAFLQAAQAKTASEFKSAFENYAVSPQNILYAHKDGEIGQIMAGYIPNRVGFNPSDLVVPESEVDANWSDFFTVKNLPAISTAQGFLVSANNRPTDTTVPLSFNFSPDDRLERAKQLLSAKPSISVEDLMLLQQDVQSDVAARMKDQIVQILQAAQLKLSADQSDFVGQLAEWQGSYSAEARGALLFELLIGELINRLYADEDGEVTRSERSWNFITSNLVQSLQNLSVKERELTIEAALVKAVGQAEKYHTWGDVHKLRAGHTLAGLPLIGKFFIMQELSAGGSRETLHKTAHELVTGKHYVTYGSQSRHISDMSDLDANFFVLFGGQDGWLGSDNFADQVELWATAQYLQVPLRLSRVKRDFTRLTVIAP